MRFDLRRIHDLEARSREALARQEQRRAAVQSWYRIENAGRGDSADVYLYDMIGMWGVTAQDFVGELNALDAKTINMYVSSEGGEVFDGLAIFEAMVRHPATINATIDGLAASAASFIVQAADSITMAPRAKMMIHDAHGGVLGNSRDLRAMADLLDELSDTIADIYAARAGGSRASWRAAMQDESGGPDGTWYDAEGAVKAGLADSVRGADPAENRIEVTGLGRAEREYLDAVPALNRNRVIEPPAAFDPAAFLQIFEDIENPVPEYDGQSMREALDLA